MNSKRRKHLNQLIESLEAIKEELDYITNEEQEAYDNMPESLQVSDRGEFINDNIESLESTLDLIQDAINNIQEVIDK